MHTWTPAHILKDNNVLMNIRYSIKVGSSSVAKC